MKRLVSSIVFFFSFLFSILFISCSSENGITAPPENKTTPLAKTTVVLPTHINHSIDTVLSLPKSNIQIVVNKSYAADKIAAMDVYYTAHPLSSLSSTPTVTPTGVHPDYQYCPYHIDSIMVFFDQYQPAPGKNLGISPTLSIESMAVCWQYGFNQIMLPTTDVTTFLSNYRTAKSLGYQDYNIGLWLPDATPSDVSNALNLIHAGPKIGFYFLDELMENNGFGGNAVNIVNDSIAPAVQKLQSNSKLVITTWRLSTNDLCGASTGVTLLNDIAIYWPNTVRIVCDQYHGNCCGNVGDYWNDYAGWYGATKNPTNFMDVLINNGGGTGICTPSFTSSDFTSLFTNYNSHGDNTAWLYAGTPHGLSDVTNYIINVAFERAYWAVRKYGYLVQTWENTDGTCNWLTGQWTVINSYYSTSYGWAYY